MKTISHTFVQRFTVGLGLAMILVGFQNCATDKQADLNGLSSTASSYAQASKDALGNANLLLIPAYYPDTPTNEQVLDTCTISNVSRGLTASVIRRAERSDCAAYCNQNRAKFARDQVTCSFGAAIAGGPDATNFFDLNHCTIKSSSGGVLVDSFQMNRTSCIAQCATQGMTSTRTQTFECYWQNRVLYYREKGSTTSVDLGTCSLSATIPDPTPGALATATITIATMVFDGDTTLDQCALAEEQLNTLFPQATVTSSALNTGFIKVGTPVSIVVR